MTKTNILIVDDREENIIALRALIQRDDVNLISTTLPNDALKLAWENEISIALVDVQMPEIDGFELVEMLKSNPRTKDILVIFVTAISKETKYAVKGLNAGAVDYLYKPLDPYITAAKVDSFIQLAKAQQLIKIKNEELANYATIVNNSADIICSIDSKSGRILSVSPAVEKIIGFKQEEIIEKKITDLIFKDSRDAFMANVQQLLKEGYPSCNFETRIKKFDDQVIWADCRATCRNGIYFLNISDISSKKKFEEDIIEAKDEALIAKKAKEVFLANMSHELRTPINGIIGISNLLLHTELGKQQSEMVKLLEVSSQSLLGIVNDILDISKIESGNFSITRKEINLKEQIKSIAQILSFKADEKLVKFNLIIENEVPSYIEADGLRLNQILMNLLSNAIKFTEKGSVTLHVKLINQTSDKVKISFEVRDTGIGIPKESLNSIFDSYQQASYETAVKYGGTGLGLTIVKKLADLKGGELKVESELGKGSNFTFINDFSLQNGLSNFIIDFKSQLDGFEGLKILVAEDNLVNQFMIKKILKSWKVEVNTAETGVQVLEKLAIKDYDLILMDTHMPEMGGFEATKKIRNEFGGKKQSIKIISLSAAVLEEEKQAALSCGMNDVLSKPFIPQDLHRIISKQLVSANSI